MWPGVLPKYVLGARTGLCHWTLFVSVLCEVSVRGGLSLQVLLEQLSPLYYKQLCKKSQGPVIPMSLPLPSALLQNQFQGQEFQVHRSLSPSNNNVYYCLQTVCTHPPYHSTPLDYLRYLT